MATISRTSLIYKWAYLWTVGREKPRSTDLCTLFWRCVAITPVITAFAGAVTTGVGYVLFLIIRSMFRHPGTWGWALLLGLSAIAVGVLVTVVTGFWKPLTVTSEEWVSTGAYTRSKQPVEQKVNVWEYLANHIFDALDFVVEGIKARKEKSCTLYEVTDD